jgi:8-hydroxy-5-deazaflavin:NADPH oxidoreductase
MPPSRLAVLGGTGQQGRGLAQRFARAGFPVIVGSRAPDRAAALVAGWPDGARPIATADYGAAIERATVVVLAVPFESVGRLLDDRRQQFRADALVVDVTVPVTFGQGGPALAEVPEGSAAQHIRARLPAHARLAATFKTVPAHLLGDIERPLDCDEFVCGDSAEARTEAAALVQAIAGLRPIDVGPLARARAIEHVTLLAIAINRRHRIADARFKVIGL